MVEEKRVEQNCAVELTFISEKSYSDPFNELELWAVFSEPDGQETLVPAFWAGDNIWRLRHTSSKLGKHYFHTRCSDTSNTDLHECEGVLEVIHYTGMNPLMQHGPLRVSQDRRYLEHRDGKPFFWLGDTWWMGLTKRLRWPEGFQLLTADRVAKGFTVIQIVAGLYPDMPPFDPRGANEAGFPWEEGYVRVNPAYFDMMDERIDWLVKNGLVPCIVGAWGYFIEFMGEESMMKHWRYLVARYGAYPVVWCVAGEAVMPYYLSPVRGDKERHREYAEKTRVGWSRVTRYLRFVDPYHHPVTIHPTDCAHNMVDDASLIDIDMLQTGHSDLSSLGNTVNQVVSSIERSPHIPVLVGEVCYEGIKGESWENVQRIMFWTSILNGAAGHTYGANGVWQVNTRLKPFGPSPHGRSWVDTPWEDAYQLPGSKQVGLCKQLLERYPWWRFNPHPDWVEPHWSRGDYFQPYAAGIPKEVRVVFIPGQGRGLSKIKAFEPEAAYHAFYFDPRNGREYDLGIVVPSEAGEWQPPNPPSFQDWVIVLENTRL